MLPPLFLDVRPHHFVRASQKSSEYASLMLLELRWLTCAQPQAQKCAYTQLLSPLVMLTDEFEQTAQLLEMMHTNDISPSHTAPSSAGPSSPSGLLVANDSDHKRAHVLVHSSARLPSPALMVTNLDASILPALRVPPAVLGRTGSAARVAPAPVPSVDDDASPNVQAERARKRRDGRDGLVALKFDRILCDVPCSGDGTIRKNMGIWKRWGPQEANGLHTFVDLHFIVMHICNC